MADFSFLVSFLSAISSIAIILGAVFVVFQLRQNAKLIKTASHETKSNMSFAVLEKITEESFARRRKNMHDAVKKYSEVNWQGFDDSLEDFEARNFGYIYELIGEFEPLVKHIMDRYKVPANPYENFEWLAKETRKVLEESGKIGDTFGRASSVKPLH